MIVATNAAKDVTIEYVTVYATTSPPLLLPDNYDTASGDFIFTACKDTGNYNITGQTDPGAGIGGVLADADGRFSVTGTLGTLAGGVNTDTVTLAVANPAGMITMREVSIVRGTENEPVTPPGGGGGGSTTNNASVSPGKATFIKDAAQDVSVTLNSGGNTLLSLKNGTYTLVRGTDYNVSGNIVTIKASYPATLSVGDHDIIFHMSGGIDPKLTITVKDTAESGGSKIETPAGGDPVTNPDGSVTLPLGGTITLPNGTVITVPAGTVISADGNRITIPKDGAGGTITHPNNHSFSYRAEAVFTLDSNSTLGYSIRHDNPFDDIKGVDWFYDSVMFAYAHGLMNGTSADPMLFSPNVPLTRGMIVTVLYRMAGSPDVSGLPNPFSDVPGDRYYADAVKWAAANGIVSGYGKAQAPTA